MSEPKHTPGPWKADTGSGCKKIKGDKHRSGAHRQAQYVELAMTTGLSDEAEDAANAKLIAAAPTLADALESVRASAQCGCTLREVESGHRSDCWLPHWLTVAEDALRAAGRLP